MKKNYLLMVFLLLCSVCVHAQRKTDALSRGLVVVPTGSGDNAANLVSWRQLANEYYDVTYNLYRDGTMIASNLTTTSYEDVSFADATYQVAAVVKGVELA